MLLDGPTVVKAAPAQVSAPSGWGSPGVRHVILHYHLFKNAGTSLDRAFQDNFSSEWVNADTGNKKIPTDSLVAFIRQHPHGRVFSAHNMTLPPPVIDGVAIFPVTLARHPIDRVLSIYRFERQQQSNTPGARHAKELDFAGYVRWRLGRDRLLTHFLINHFSAAPPGQVGTLSAAIAQCHQMPFIGIVEKYNLSLDVLARLLRPAFPHIRLPSYRLNANAERANMLTERLAQTKAELGDELFEELLDRNNDELQLYEYLSRRLDLQATPATEATLIPKM